MMVMWDTHTASHSMNTKNFSLTVPVNSVVRIYFLHVTSLHDIYDKNKYGQEQVGRNPPRGSEPPDDGFSKHFENATISN